MSEPTKAQFSGKVHVVGAGGVGFWLSVALSRARVEHTVYDDDTLTGGLGYSRVPKASPATKKVSLLRGHSVVVMGDPAPAIVDRRFESPDCTAGDLVVDCTDMALPLRKELWAVCRDNGARLLRVSYDGKNGTVVVAEGLPLAGRSGGGYADVPNLALSFIAGGMGAMAVMAILKGSYEYVEFQVSVVELLAGPILAELPPLAIEKHIAEATTTEKSKRKRKAADVQST